MNESILDLDFFEDDDELFDNSFSDNGVIVDSDDWDDSSGNNVNDTEVFDNETTEDEPEEPVEQPSEETPVTDVITELLKARGIEDSSRIKFENESGEIEEKDWKDLSIEELFNIINGEEPAAVDPAVGLDDNEIDLINRIRLSRMSVDDYLAYERQKGVSAYAAQLAQLQEPSYIVDDISDDELYILDLQTKVADLTDEELEQALEAAKSNPTLYEKLIEGLRNEYKELEERKEANERAIQELAQAAQFQQFSGAVINSINNFNNIGDLDINMEDEDANELYLFITGVDPAGVNYFAKALNDPDTLTRVAWFALHGEDVINSISDYYKGVIALVSKSLYEKGKADAKPKPKKSPEVVVNPPKQNRNSRTSTIYDLD